MKKINSKKQNLKKIIIITSILITLINIITIDTFGATIQGNIYDFDLTKSNNVIVEINSTPNQITLSKDGSYKFNINPGKYLLKATKKIGTKTYIDQENITLKNNNGTYIIDLFLFLDLNDNFLNLSNIEIDEPFQKKEDDTKSNTYLLIFFIVTLVSIIYFVFRNNKNNQKDETKIEEEMITNTENEKELKFQVIEILRKNNFRMTQKEIRKSFPMSESKISLVLTELESEKIIKKIKKGRSNIIILENK